MIKIEEGIKLNLIIPETGKKIKILITIPGNLRHEIQIDVVKKTRTCQICGCKFLSMTKLSKYCGEICKAKATKNRKEGNG